eukprot:CAMPEP_0178456202 /NCGR_PEP_ID=MMETSP0689_2-20121128/46338_1 /TAXON_ID=160604 /ORGANISM="Amphidinium massartii, Strain CS-259" /LENGTH=30 /DNA_ID= /DNA_START= /DNA_END= /DNA_ORIENTATION=
MTSSCELPAFGEDMSSGKQLSGDPKKPPST